MYGFGDTTTTTATTPPPSTGFNFSSLLTTPGTFVEGYLPASLLTPVQSALGANTALVIGGVVVVGAIWLVSKMGGKGRR